MGRPLRSDSALGRRLRQQQETLTQLGVACTERLRHGLVVPELLMELRQAAYDLVVAGSSPAGDLLRTYMLGNVTREIVNHAEWPVLIMGTGTGSHYWSELGSLLFSTPHPRAKTPNPGLGTHLTGPRQAARELPARHRRHYLRQDRPRSGGPA